MKLPKGKKPFEIFFSKFLKKVEYKNKAMVLNS